jgi:hypothetical protein
MAGGGGADTAPPLPTPGDASSETLTTAQLVDRYGWSPSNAARNARENGWVAAGKRGKSKLWRRG